MVALDSYPCHHRCGYEGITACAFMYLGSEWLSWDASSPARCNATQLTKHAIH